MDKQLCQQITELTIVLDPTDWPHHYTLGDDLLLRSDHMGQVWVPENETLQQDLMMSHHDGPMAGHLSQEGTLELVTWKYTWKYCQLCSTICTRVLHMHQEQKPELEATRPITITPHA
jgi:hypothetical protein